MPSIWRSSSLSTLTSTTKMEPSDTSTVGLGMSSARAMLAFGEAVIHVTRRVAHHWTSTVSSTRLIKYSGRSLSSSASDSADTACMSNAVPSPGKTSGKAIKTLRKITLQGLDEIQLRLHLSKLDKLFPHGNQVFWEGDDGEKMYENIIDLARPGVCSSRVYKHAMHLLLTQIGFREVKQLIRGLVDWEAGRMGDLLARLMDIVLQADRDPTTQNSLAQAYIRYQDAPHIDPLLPFASFLLQLSSASVAAYEASTEAGARLLSEISNTVDFSLTHHLLETLGSMQKPIPPLHRDIFSSIVGSPKRVSALALDRNEPPTHISQWKFSWVLSHIAQGEAHWGILAGALVQGTVDHQKEFLFRIVSSILPSDFADPYRLLPGRTLQDSTDKHLGDGFHLACRKGMKSNEVTFGQDPVNLALRFVLYAMSSEPDLRVPFVHPGYFARIIRAWVPSLAGIPILDAVRAIEEHGIEWYSTAQSPEITERITLCWELFKVIPEK